MDMAWYEHLFGVLMLLVCFIGIPCGLVGIACVLAGGKEDNDDRRKSGEDKQHTEEEI